LLYLVGIIFWLIPSLHKMISGITDVLSFFFLLGCSCNGVGYASFNLFLNFCVLSEVFSTSNPMICFTDYMEGCQEVYLGLTWISFFTASWNSSQRLKSTCWDQFGSLNTEIVPCQSDKIILPSNIYRLANKPHTKVPHFFIQVMHQRVNDICLHLHAQNFDSSTNCSNAPVIILIEMMGLQIVDLWIENQNRLGYTNSNNDICGRRCDTILKTFKGIFSQHLVWHWFLFQWKKKASSEKLVLAQP
jgi:hypothetical protein